jgi:4-amino-4-deoxy-L-arabinose transferase-like glycosyltransferase
MSASTERTLVPQREVISRSRGTWDRTARAMALIAFALGLYLYLGRLASSPMQTGNESMYTYPAIHMIESGDYLIPQFENGNFLEKPPLAWWLVAASYKVFGVSVAAGRVPGAILSLATILVVYLWVRRRRGDRSAALAALVLMFTYMYWTYMRYSAADVFLTFAVTLSILALDAMARRSGGSDAICGALSGGALALSFGFKGLAGLVMPVGGVALGLLMDRVLPVRFWRRGLIAAGVLVLLLAPWHWAMTERLGGEFWRVFYWDNQFRRGATTLYAPSRGLFYYVPILAFAAFPWSFFLPQSLRRERPSSVPMGWLLFGLAFWSVLVMKREVYLMPLFPAVAILVAERLDREATHEDPQPKLAWAIAAGVLALVLMLLTWIFGFLSKLLSFDSVAGVVLTGALLLIVLLIGARTRERVRLPFAVALACGLTFLALERLDERINRYDPIPEWGERIRRECADGCDGFYVSLNMGQQEYYTRFNWVPLGKPQEVVGRTRHGKAFMIMDSSAEPQLSEIPMRSEVVDRRPWLAGNWITAAWKPGKSALESLSLVRIEVPEPASR